MEYVTTYDFVGLILLVIIYFLNYSVTKAPSRTTRLFRAFIVWSFLASFLDVFTIWTNHYTSTFLTLALNYILAIVHLSAVATIPLVYYLFVLSITYDQKHIPKNKRIFTSVLYFYDIFTITSSPITHFVFYYDETGAYLHGPGFIGSYAVLIIFIIAGVFELSKNYKKISKTQFYTVLSYSLIDIGTAIYQFINPAVLLVGFSSAASLMIISKVLKNPMEFIDSNTGMFNRFAFKEYLYSIPSKRVLAIINIKNADSIKYKYGLDNGYRIIRKSISKIIEECHQKLSFYIFNNTFVFVCKDEDDAREKLAILSKYKTNPLDISLDSGNTKLSVLIESEFFIIEDPQLLSNITDADSKKDSLDQIIDVLQFLIESLPQTNEVSVIDEQFIEYYKERIRIQKIVDDAIINEKFEVFLQPIFDLESKCFTGAESLIRLRGSDGKMISPGLFIPEAEKNGKILALGDISIKKTCEFIKNGNLLNLGIQKVNINLSMVQCMQDNIVEHLIELIDSYDIPKNAIRFEITETMTSTNPEKLKYVMESLSEHGIEFALDDYGTGYSNTSRLLTFPFSEIKFDKSFVDSAMEDKRNALPLKHLMNMVSDSKMIVLVEGIETKEMSDLIESYGGNLIQGFFYARPLPMTDFVEFIKEKNNITE